MTDERERMRGALIGMVVGDALAMPVHWLYSTENIAKHYGTIDKMMAPKPTHPESMLGGVGYTGTIELLHDKRKYYGNERAAKGMSEAEIKEKTDLHGNFVGHKEHERPHYHASLKKGQSTHNVCVARLLMRYLSKKYEALSGEKAGYFEVYDPSEFIEAFYQYTTADASKMPEAERDLQLDASNDTYFDVYVRRYFENVSQGVKLVNAAYNQRETWSIGSLDGLVMSIPLMIAYIHDPEAFLVARAIEHASLTHRSVTVHAAIAAIAPLFQKLVAGVEPFDAILDEAMSKFRTPTLTGYGMSQSYKLHRGPGNIPKAEKWRQHMETTKKTMKEEIRELAQGEKSFDYDQTVVGWSLSKQPCLFHSNQAFFFIANARFSEACYVEHCLAVVFYLLCRYGDDTKTCLSYNAQLGGHSTARGESLCDQLVSVIHLFVSRRIIGCNPWCKEWTPSDSFRVGQ